MGYMLVEKTEREDVDERESKKSKVSETSQKRKSEDDHRDLDVEGSQRDEQAQASSGSGQKRPAEDPPDDSERGERLGILDEAGTRVPVEGSRHPTVVVDYTPSNILLPKA